MPTVRDLKAKTGEEPITMLTAYDAPTAGIVDDADVDVILVGDSVGNTSLGYETTLPVTVDDVARHVGAVSRATEDALVVADMPFLSFGVDETDSLENAGRMLKEEGAEAVKLESGPHTVELTEKMVQLGIPVMAHLGLTPQHVNQYGGYPRQGTDQDAAERILELARAHEEAGAFSLVLEHVPSNVAAEVTDAIDVPTIGIGAGPDCDGQVLVVDDAVGLSEWSPSFSKQFGSVREEMENAVEEYVSAVESGRFPAEEHSHEETDLEEFY
ncbi:3-methyl-2-oxobutanoate hydroxymethyltransferase [Natronobacterium gregoryi]|uniref:3-methyl-2-oxobutanoate hydroxymethyltransferase n=2 Tax=Natronobacterium gregoryi TaxID=44930 RepID=L0AK54_NATGS|nr:3-methyl-2-oxobutanoate hydroxymethyltransferase [Natronobacterium gregoryi]AFZ74161.1 3-methyl-2-oxobutanoate hydroxymethyltransferase [Natronobacterium gregoryi SP2]ELY63616.1 3-methyl-2-oxobutanoate hydroxymethyltransferase [Natronobacterium gregoryi SP2]PLK22046.1 3-methyl-2-oxobutanoate hydroxymethyltransferase [Natronobacterium gregoryi SP2]SFI50597.1 ketopantoate hydroxymethyltransferase [Natronobacterium gregoryi]